MHKCIHIFICIYIYTHIARAILHKAHVTLHIAQVINIHIAHDTIHIAHNLVSRPPTCTALHLG